MSSFLEQYGVAIFTLVLIAILIAFAGPLGIKIKNATTDKVSQTEQIGKDEITVATGGTVRPEEPAEAVDQVWCYIDKNNELVISQNKITAPSDALVKEKQVSKPMDIISNRSIIHTARFEGAVKPKSCNSWFYYCDKLTEIKNIQNLYTNECINMEGTFQECQSLTSLDLSNFDTSKVTDMGNMFADCYSLTSLDLSNFDTSKVTNMSSMFRGCGSLTSLDLSNFDTSKVTYMHEMFWRCKSLTSLDLSNFDTSKVTYMFKMFGYCYSLTSLDLSNFDTSKVTDMGNMFADCYSLTSLDLSNFDTSKVTYMSEMFANCTNLKSITSTQATKDKILLSSSNANVPSGCTWTIVESK